jgi:capsular polysaccharide export protein
MSMVADRAGIFYAANAPSDLARIIAEPDWFTPEMAERAARGLEQIRRLRLSKYNSGLDRTPEELGLSATAKSRILVIDQVRDDASFRGALANADSFKAMLAAALDENPGSEVVVKLHPDALSGRRTGYFSGLGAMDRLRLVDQQTNPWSLIDAAATVYTVSSGLGFEAVLAGKQVVCFGSPFYSGWGFTDDRRPGAPREREATLPQVFAAFYLRYSRYFDAYSRHEIPFEDACEQLAWLRDRFLSRPGRAVCHRIAPWKRGSFARILEGPAGAPLHVSDAEGAAAMARATSGYVVTWASRDKGRLQTACDRAGVRLVRAEDGFVRSAGLGASFVPPLSLVLDGRGIYYDSRSPSDLEEILNGSELPQDLRDRAEHLIGMLVRTGTTKYNVAGRSGDLIDGGGRPVILVPGQVEDDASIRQGSPRLQTNLGLLSAVRNRHPDAYIVYKPHPDVEAGIRKGRVPADRAAALADRIVTQGSILQLIAQSDRIETMTSLTGFEALLRGKAVTAHGQPFYAGWGLTEDLCPLPRRTRRRSLDELVAAALILYPDYIDPLSGLPCQPELLIERLASAGRREPNLAERAARIGRFAVARALHFGRSVKRRA